MKVSDTEGGDFQEISTEEHIAKVTKKIEENFSRYFDSLVSRYEVDPATVALQAKFGGKSKPKPAKDVLREQHRAAIDSYDTEAQRYREFLDEENLEEYQDFDPSAFKTALRKDCPIVRKAINAKMEAMKEWKIKFKMTSSQDFLDVFSNLRQFADDYAEAHSEDGLSAMDSVDELELTDLDYEEDYRIEGVIGGGIRSCVLYHLYPASFARMSRGGLYGLYFLTDRMDFGLPSRTSEFLMIDDRAELGRKGLKLEHNFHYPYRLFSLYSHRLFRLIQKQCMSVGATVDPAYRFVYVENYFDEIWTQHETDIKTMMCYDELGRYGVR